MYNTMPLCELHSMVLGPATKPARGNIMGHVSSGSGTSRREYNAFLGPFPRCVCMNHTPYHFPRQERFLLEVGGFYYIAFGQGFSRGPGFQRTALPWFWVHHEWRFFCVSVSRFRFCVCFCFYFPSYSGASIGGLRAWGLYLEGVDGERSVRPWSTWPGNASGVWSLYPLQMKALVRL
ncbi:hypothetical protein N658DRAFT_185834 [Parathielavia hyrcaniae]|uniref:Uncharacterized protein n=1 Tax=Parathielavia hyrcaniae TaxID=113614 RepID=A0AAN6T4P0_9PEZI|nr:hypothetical protein N658DRAFT_185834 [Parathielavia hyrcaniae]